MTIIQKLSKYLQVSLILIFSFLLLAFSFLLSYDLIFWKKIYPRIKIANIEIGGRTQEQANKILQHAVGKQKKTLKLKFENQVWEISLANLEFTYLSKNSINKAYLVGRSNGFKKNLDEKINGLKKEVNLDIDYQIKDSSLKTAIASISAQIDIPSIHPNIQLIKEFGISRIEIQTGQPGKEVDQKKLKQLVHHQMSQLLEPSIFIPIKQLLPPISQEQVKTTKIRAEKFLNKKLVLAYKENSWNVEEAELINFLNFSKRFDQIKIASFTAQLSKSIDRPPQNALFNFQAGRVIEFKPAKDGQTLNQNQTKKLINQTLKDLEEKEEKIVNIILPVNLTKPTIVNEEVNNLGIKELIGKGESWFSGSINSRIHNVQLASNNINGLLINPNETFSLNQALGDISIQTGYQKAWIIKEGRTVLGDGGGVCQVSTTLFRAILSAGLPIIERRAHAYRVSYYEQNYQVGVDATVFAPSPDLKFKNDTPGHILIQTYVDPINMYARYDLYGTSDGRQISISQSRIWDQTPPPPDLHQDDPTLAAGVVKQIDWSAWGAKTAFDWKVVRNNEVLQEKTFYSYYKPWQAIFLKGTAGQ